jgi:hypothetical protein
MFPGSKNLTHGMQHFRGGPIVEIFVQGIGQMFVKRRTPLACQHSQAPGVWLVVRQDDALALLEVRIANGVQFQKIPWAETARCGLWW